MRIRIDGETAGYIGGGFRTFDRLPGEHTISVDLWDRPGKCALDITAPAGSDYYFQIGPRRSLVGAIVGEATVGTGIGSIGPGTAVAGTAVLGAVSRSQPCSGDFYIEPISKEMANSKFADLKKKLSKISI